MRFSWRRKPYEFEAKGLMSVGKTDYGDKYADHFLELYKFYADTACQVSSQRVSANTFFLTLNASIVAVYGLGASFSKPKVFLILVPIAGLLVCATWNRLISSYRSLNRAKYDLLREMEDHLPVAIYRHEWDLLKHGKTKEYVPLSTVEKWVPICFALLYLLLIAYGWFVPPVDPSATLSAK